MIGNQAIKLLLQLITSTYGTIIGACKACCNKSHKPKNQWEIDNQLENFDSNTLLEEYLHISTRLFFLIFQQDFSFNL
jgi:hypothetical protein